MRNVLVPTDFSPASLEWVEKTAQALSGDSLNIILFHAFNIPFFVSDMVRPSGLPYQDLLTEPFRHACASVRRQHPKTIKSITVRHMFGNSNAVFRNFIDANDIDLIVYPEFYAFRPVHGDSVNPHNMFMKSGTPMLRSFLPRRKVENQPVENNNIQLKKDSYVAKEEHPVQVYIREN